MIINQLSNLAAYLENKDYNLVNNFINNFGLNAKAIGKWSMLDDDKLKIIVLDKSNFKENIFEAHRKYQDIHITLRGKDTIYYANSASAMVMTPYIDQDDYELKIGTLSSIVVLHPQTFAILDPGELHTNKIEDNSTIKIVIKRKIN
jgi:biofilm protein TabA